MDNSCLLIIVASINSLKLLCYVFNLAISPSPFFNEAPPNSRNMKFHNYLTSSDALSSTPLETINSTNWFVSGILVLDIIIPQILSWISLDCCFYRDTAGIARIPNNSLSDKLCLSSVVILGLVK
jgi:hypothetical protein